MPDELADDAQLAIPRAGVTQTFLPWQDALPGEAVPATVTRLADGLQADLRCPRCDFRLGRWRRFRGGNALELMPGFRQLDDGVLERWGKPENHWGYKVGEIRTGRVIAPGAVILGNRSTAGRESVRFLPIEVPVTGTYIARCPGRRPGPDHAPCRALVVVRAAAPPDA